MKIRKVAKGPAEKMANNRQEIWRLIKFIKAILNREGIVGFMRASNVGKSVPLSEILNYEK